MSLAEQLCAARARQAGSLAHVGQPSKEAQRSLPPVPEECTAGRLLCWGRNDYGRCGVGDTKHLAEPKQVPDLWRIVQVRGGAGHTLAIGEDGQAYAFGKNYLGQLGVGDDEDRYYPHRVRMDGKVVACSGGGNFSAFVTEEGQVFTTGCGYFHATGHPSEAHLHIPAQVPFSFAAHIVDVACGELHAIALSEDGRCFAWGRNTEGQCGQGEVSRFCAAPVPVKGLDGFGQVRKLSSCFNWNMIVAREDDDKEHVLVWGENDSGQLGQPLDVRYLALPTLISVIDAQAFLAISCGKDHGVAVDGDGKVWTWGIGEVGQLGIDLEAECRSQTQPRLPRSIPFFVERRDQIKVIDVAAAKKHTLFLTSSGQVFFCGDDQFGNEELDKPVRPRFEPHLLELPMRIAAIGAGGYHSCIVTSLEHEA